MAAAVAATFLLCSVLVFHGWNQHRIATQYSAVSGPPRILADVRPAVLLTAQRRVYPFSIIPGGAFSKEELVHALESDPVAESHYGMFQRAQLRPVRSTFTKPVYLSYRKGNLIFWTSHPVYLHEGETVLTDGNLYARGRCGNRISLAPQAPVAEAEPATAVLDTPEPMEAIPEPLLQAAVELEPEPTIPPVVGPEDFASPVGRPLEFDAPPDGLIADTFLNLMPVIGLGDNTVSLPTVNVPTQLSTGPYPSTVTSPAPESSDFVLTIGGIGAIVLWSLRAGRGLKTAP